MSASPNYGLEFQAAGNLQTDLVINAVIRLLDSLLNLSPEDKDLSADPTTVDGDAGKTWIIASGGSGDWTGKAAGTVALCVSANVWAYFTPKKGWKAYVRDEDATYVYTGSVWQASVSAAEVSYDNSTSGLTSTNGQDALDELAAAIGVTGNAMTHIGTVTVTGSAATTLAITGLDLSSYKAFLISYALDNATGSSSNVSVYYNSDTTATNYYNQVLTGNNTAVSGARTNDAFIIALTANETSTGNGFIKNDLDGKPRLMLQINRGAPSSIIIQPAVHVWNSATNVTGITLSASAANSLAVGSKFSVFGIN